MCQYNGNVIWGIDIKKRQGKNDTVPSMSIPRYKYKPQTLFGISDCRRNDPNKQHIV